MKNMGMTQQKTLNNGDETMKMAGAAFFFGHEGSIQGYMTTWPSLCNFQYTNIGNEAAQNRIGIEAISPDTHTHTHQGTKTHTLLGGFNQLVAHPI